MMDKWNVVLTFTEPLLGTAPLNKELYSDYVANYAPTEEAADEELATIAETVEKGTTGFHRVNDQPILYDYVIKGFFKDACGMLRRVAGTGSVKMAAYKKIIDGLLFVTPRRIPIDVLGEVGILERPLRAQTAQGERVALARSETVAEGSKIAFTVTVLDGITEKQLREWLDYGALRGLGQWRNASWGRFDYTLAKQA